MHLMEVLARRQTPAAGLYLSLTRRCPLSCAHCSTSSTLRSEEHPGELFRQLVETFTTVDRPDVLVLTGGEPLLRARLVVDLVERAHTVGTAVVVASGMFFARLPRIPPAIAEALELADHVSASLDVFHEREVPRAATFAVLRRLVDRGKDVSLLVTGMDAEDHYLHEVIADARESFSDRVPIMVGLVKPQGRAMSWMERDECALPATEQVEPDPCMAASWPVVSYDGTVLACCGTDEAAPPHLRLGHIAQDGWPIVRERSVGSPVLRGIRMVGPRHIAWKYGGRALLCDGYCATCARLSDDPAVARELTLLTGRPTTRTVEEIVARMRHDHFVAGTGPAEFRSLLGLGQGAASAAGSWTRG